MTKPDDPEQSPTPSAELSPREEEFCKLYILHGRNGAAAAQEAGYAPRSARQTGSRLIHTPKIAKRIKELSDDRQARIDELLDVIGPETIRRLGEIAAFDVRSVMSEDGKTIDAKALMDYDGPLPLIEIQEIALKGGSKTVYKFANPIQAANKLADIAGLVTNKHEHSGGVELTPRLDLFSEIFKQVSLEKPPQHSRSASDTIEPTKTTA